MAAKVALDRGEGCLRVVKPQHDWLAALFIDSEIQTEKDEDTFYQWRAKIYLLLLVIVLLKRKLTHHRLGFLFNHTNT